MAKISVYDKLETNFTHNGLVLSDAIVCTVEEELNGKYVLELVHPIDEKGKWENLIEENIIKADGQLFRIHSTESNLNYVYVYARHIFYDLLHNFLEDVRPTNINGSGALNWILSNTQYPHNFIGISDIDALNTQYYIRKNPVEAMLGTDSLVTRWNGELVRDNYTIKLLSSRGQNKGAQIAYGKNILGLEVKRDMDTVITRIMPVGREGLLLPEKYIDSPLINNYTFPHIRKVEFDVGVDEDTTEAQAFEKLRQGAKNLYEINKVDIPYVNINTNLLLLENTEEYKHLKNLVKVNLGDIVSCTDNPLKITFEAKVIRIKKDVLSNKNVEVELGQFKKGISNTIQNAINEVSDELKKNTSDLEKAIERATELLTNALGGYVVKRPGELLIMDTEDINTATKVWRWNLNGLGYSDVGINGPYRLAMTMEGKINADFITTGTLNAGIVKTGVLTSKDNKTWINLDDGSFNFKDELKWDNATKKLILGPNAQISWGSVENKPFIPSQYTNAMALQAWINSGYSTHITSNGVYTGTVAANKILIGGTNGFISFNDLSNKPWIPQNASDVGAKPDDWVPSWSEIKAKPTILTANDIKTTVITKEWIATLGLLVGSEIQMGKNATIRWSSVTSKPTILTSTDVTTITNNTISTTTVEAVNLKVRSANITGDLVARGVLTKDRNDNRQLEMFGNNLYFYDLSRDTEIGSLGTLRYNDDYRTTAIILNARRYSGWALAHDNYDVIAYKPHMRGQEDLTIQEKTRFWRDMDIRGDLYVVGRKDGLHITDNYGERLISAYETTEYYYGDLGTGLINDDGECLVHIDEIFQECVNTNINYHVFTQAYNGRIESIVKEKSYFIVYGEPNTEFSWELKAKRRGYEEERMPAPSMGKDMKPSNIVETNSLEESAEDSKLRILMEDLLTYDLTELLLNEGGF